LRDLREGSARVPRAAAEAACSKSTAINWGFSTATTHDESTGATAVESTDTGVDTSVGDGTTTRASEPHLRSSAGIEGGCRGRQRAAREHVELAVLEDRVELVLILVTLAGDQSSATNYRKKQPTIEECLHCGSPISKGHPNTTTTDVAVQTATSVPRPATDNSMRLVGDKFASETRLRFLVAPRRRCPGRVAGAPAGSNEKCAYTAEAMHAHF